jgi:hypothetical protein
MENEQGNKTEKSGVPVLALLALTAAIIIFLMNTKLPWKNDGPVVGEEIPAGKITVEWSRAEDPNANE